MGTITMDLYKRNILITCSRSRSGSGAASQWLFNFLMAQATPYVLETAKWRTFILFGILNYGVVAFAVSFLKEVSMLQICTLIVECKRH